ncbi:MAG: hypothetical protein ACOCYU_05285 [Brevefilum sp.]
MEVLILLALGGLTWLADFALEKSLENRVSAYPAEDVYFIPSYFRKPLLLVAVVLIPLEIVVPLAWVIRPVNGIEIGIGLGLPAIMLPLLVFALVMIWIHFGAIVLTGKSVKRYFLIGFVEIPFREIHAIKQDIHFLSPVTTVAGASKKIRFPRQMQGHPQLYLVLCDKLKTNQQTDIIALSSDEKGFEFPFTFGVSPKRLIWENVAFVLLLLIFAVVATMGIWIQLAQDMLPPFTYESLLIIGLFFVPFGVIFPILVVIVYKQTVDPDQPVRFVLHRDRIEVFYPHQRQECYQVSDLQSVSLRPLQANLKSSFDGVTVSEQITHYEFVLQFTGGKIFTLTPNRLALFKQTPEHLRSIFRDCYGI